MTTENIQQTVREIISVLKKQRDEKNLLGMKRFAIDTENAFGIKLPVLRSMAKQFKNDHELALGLWESGYHECRLLAIFIDDPKQVTEKQMESWIKGFKSWDLCDQACALFDKTTYAVKKVYEWSTREAEFEELPLRS